MASIPKGIRVYAIGDIHGEMDLLRRLLLKVEEDSLKRGKADTQIVVLGDVIDRGKESAQVVRLLHRIQSKNKRVVVLKGNHEAILLQVLAGDFDSLALWVEHGGVEALESWGISAELADPERMRELVVAMREAIPREHVRWLQGLPVSHRVGDYLFVHAGVRPGTKLRQQKPEDMLWIRDPFLTFEGDHGVVVVHGHSIVHDGPEHANNRIAVDTGAYSSGRLSAVGLEGNDHWFISTDPDEDPNAL